jgi:hypothetical protein
MTMVSLHSAAAAHHTALHNAAAMLRRCEAAATMAARMNMVARLSRKTMRWKYTASGLNAKTATARAAQPRFIRSRRASTNSSTQLIRSDTSIASRPTMTALGSRSKPSVSHA